MTVTSQEDRPPWIYRVVPAFDALRHYRLTDARADLLAGITVAAVAVPQAMAYALAAGLPAQYGLYTAIIMTAVGALFASSRQLINGPTNAISIAVLSVISIVPSVDEKIQAAVLLAFMVGIIQLVITSMRLGDLTRYISHSVIIGFTLGASALLVLDQMKNLLGLASMGGVHDTFLYRFWLTMTQGGDVNTATLSIGLATMAMVLGAALAQEPSRVAPAARVAHHGAGHGCRRRVVRARGQRRAGRGRNPGEAADTDAPDDRLRADS